MEDCIRHNKLGTREKENTTTGFMNSRPSLYTGAHICIITGCLKPQGQDGRGHFYRYCHMHRDRRYRRADMSAPPKWPKPDDQLLSKYRYVNREGKFVIAHRAIWAAAYGVIPEGCVIHHLDGNGLNNSLDNLAMMTKAEHDELHAREHSAA